MIYGSLLTRDYSVLVINVHVQLISLPYVILPLNISSNGLLYYYYYFPLLYYYYFPEDINNKFSLDGGVLLIFGSISSSDSPFLLDNNLVLGELFV